MKTVATITKSASAESKKAGTKNAIVQPKLKVNAPGDQYEKEADAMAEKVMRSGLSEHKISTGLIGKSVQRKCAECEDEEKKKKNGIVMRKASDGGGIDLSGHFVEQLTATKGGGELLSDKTRTFMENAFSADFKKVRIHTDSSAAAMNEKVHAKAFTHGSDIYFNSGKYDDQSSEGKRLLAHELTHTLQQGESQYFYPAFSSSNLIQRVCDPTISSCVPESVLPIPSQTPVCDPNVVSCPPVSTEHVSERTLHLLAYASTVLSRIPRLSVDQQNQLDEIINESQVYILIRRRNEAIERIGVLRNSIVDLEGRNELIDQGVELEGGVGASPELLNSLRTEIEELTVMIDILNVQIAASLNAVGIANEEALIHKVTTEFPELWISRATVIAYQMIDSNLEAARELKSQIEPLANRIMLLEEIRMRMTPSGGTEIDEQYASSYAEVMTLPELHIQFEQKVRNLPCDHAPQNVLGWLDEIIGNINTSKENIGGRIKVWDITDIPFLTYQSLGVDENSVLGDAVRHRVADIRSDETTLNILRGALEIAIIIGVSILFTPAAGAVVGAGFGLDHLIDDAAQYSAESAASNASIDPLLADISNNEPALWPIVLDIIGLGFDAGAIMTQLRPAARALITAGETAEFENVVRRLLPAAEAESLIASAERQAGVATRELAGTGEHAFADLAESEIDEIVGAIGGEGMEAGSLMRLQPHGRASAYRAANLVSGQAVQSAHFGAQSGLRILPGYNPNEMFTVLVQRALHSEIDEGWKQTFRIMASANPGQTRITAQTFFNVIADSVNASSLTAAEKLSFIRRLTDELFVELGLGPNSMVRLPYSR